MKNKKIFYFMILMFAVLGAGGFQYVQAAGNTYYASPMGSGITCSSESPCVVQAGIGKLSAGDTLLLENGTYTATSGMIYVTESTNGTQANPIIIKAKRDGAVTLDGSGAGVRPIGIYGNWVSVEGMNAHGMPIGFDSVVKIAGDNDAVKKVVAWDVNPDVNNASVFIAHNSLNALFEDVAGWGRGRKIFTIQGDSGTNYRRCFGMWSGFTAGAASATDGINTGYHSDENNRNVFENCIMTADRTTGTFTGPGIAVIGGSSLESGSPELYGNIVYILPNQTNPFYGGFYFNSYKHDVDLIDSIVYMEGDDMKTLADYKTGAGVVITYDYTTTIGGGGISASASVFNNQLINPAISSLGGDILQYNSLTRPSVGAWIKYRYENGQLTSKPLWPWPMDERIKDALIQSGYVAKGIDGNGGTNVTKTVFELGGGTMPDFNSDTTPPAAPQGVRVE